MAVVVRGDGVSVSVEGFVALERQSPELLFCLTSKKSDNAYQLHAMYLSAALTRISLYTSRGALWRAICTPQQTRRSLLPLNTGAEPRYKKHIPK
jgi:hypothetical protein